MNCDEAGRLLEAYIDGDFELTRQVDLKVHLADCATCKNAAESAIDFGSTDSHEYADLQSSSEAESKY